MIGAIAHADIATRRVAGAQVLLLDDDALAREAVAGALRDPGAIWARSGRDLGALVHASANKA